MPNLIKIHNVETGEIVEREMTKSEVDQLKLDIAKANERKEFEALKAAQRKQLLEKLGLSEEEAQILLS